MYLVKQADSIAVSDKTKKIGLSCNAIVDVLSLITSELHYMFFDRSRAFGTVTVEGRSQNKDICGIKT